MYNISKQLLAWHITKNQTRHYTCRCLALNLTITLPNYNINRLEHIVWRVYFTELRLDNFIVEASNNILPEGVEYSASAVNGGLCAQFQGRPPPTPTELFCTGEAIGRYVYVHISYDEQMTICELEVYGQQRTYHISILFTHVINYSLDHIWLAWWKVLSGIYVLICAYKYIYIFSTKL